MSAHSIVGRVTCINGEIVPLTARQQVIIVNLGRRFKNRDAVVAVLEHWERMLPVAASPHQIRECMEDILHQEPTRNSPFVALAVA
jgi:predicted ATPase